MNSIPIISCTIIYIYIYLLFFYFLFFDQTIGISYFYSRIRLIGGGMGGLPAKPCPWKMPVVLLAPSYHGHRSPARPARRRRRRRRRRTINVVRVKKKIYRLKSERAGGGDTALSRVKCIGTGPFSDQGFFFSVDFFFFFSFPTNILFRCFFFFLYVRSLLVFVFC